MGWDWDGMDGMDGWMVTKYQRPSKSTCGANKKPKKKMKPKHILLKVNTKEISWESSFVVSEKQFNCCSEIQN